MKDRIKESQTEVVNGVHPLHWATSPGPSPMGTDPINLFKMVQKWFWKQLQQLNRMLYKVFKTPLLEITISIQRQRKLKYNRECRLLQHIVWTLRSKSSLSFS